MLTTWGAFILRAGGVRGENAQWRPGFETASLVPRAHPDTAPDFSLSPRRRSGERARERGCLRLQWPSSPRPSPPSEGGEGVRRQRMGEYRDAPSFRFRAFLFGNESVY